MQWPPSGRPVAAQWPPQWPPSGRPLKMGIRRVANIKEERRFIHSYSFLMRHVTNNGFCGRPLGGHCGGHCGGHWADTGRPMPIVSLHVAERVFLTIVKTLEKNVQTFYMRREIVFSSLYVRSENIFCDFMCERRKVFQTFM